MITFQRNAQGCMYVRSLAKAIIRRSTVLSDDSQLKETDALIERLRQHLPEVKKDIDTEIEVTELVNRQGGCSQQTFTRKLLTICILYYSDNLALIEEMISNKADLNAMDSDGNAALHAAAGLGKTEVIKLLLSHKADLYLPNAQHETALEIAIERGNSEAAELLERASEKSLALN